MEKDGNRLCTCTYFVVNVRKSWDVSDVGNGVYDDFVLTMKFNGRLFVSNTAHIISLIAVKVRT